MIILYNNRGGRETAMTRRFLSTASTTFSMLYHTCTYVHTWHTQAISTVSDVSTLNAMTIAHPIKYVHVIQCPNRVTCTQLYYTQHHRHQNDVLCMDIRTYLLYVHTWVHKCDGKVHLCVHAEVHVTSCQCCQGSIVMLAVTHSSTSEFR